jgi:hypothetical protein
VDVVRTRTVIATLVVAALAGCGACDQPPSDALEDCTTSSVFAGRVKTDILFVIDDSGSMADEQERVRAGLSRFVATLASSPIANDFQIGVTNTSVEKFAADAFGNLPANGQVYSAGPASGVPYPDGARVAVDPATVVSGTASTYGDFLYAAPAPDPGFFGSQIMASGSPSLVTDFQNNVLVGTNGSSREQPFRAAELALTARLSGENAGFLRPGARLAIIFVTDEDDCSGPPDGIIRSDTACRDAGTDPASSLVKISDFAAFLQGPIGGEVRDVVIGAIAGVDCTNGVCTTSTVCSGAVSAPDRIVALLNVMPPARTRLASICDPTFDQALDQFADAIMSQTLPLDGAVADYRMLVATVTKAGGAVETCRIADRSDPNAGAIYEAPSAGKPASLTFQRNCALEPGDAVSVDVVCIR